MNNKFDFGRFGKVLSLDFKRCIRNFGTSFIVMWCIPLALWIPTLAFDFSMPSLVRVYSLFITVFISTILAPAKTFGDINLRREGIRFAMLPATTLEKYLSYALCCTLIPIVVFLGGFAVDSLLTLLPFGGFDSFITSFGFVDNLSKLMGDPNSGVWQPGGDVMALFDSFGKFEMANFIVAFLFQIAFFMLGNLMFRFRNKAGLSFLILMGFSSIVSVISRTVLMCFEPQLLLVGEESGPEFIAQIMGRTMLITIIVNAVLSIGLYIASYYKMKSLKY